MKSKNMGSKYYQKPSFRTVWGGVIIRDNIVIYVHSSEKLRNDLVTYKFLCFDGQPKVMYMTVKNDDIWENYYDMDFNQLSISHGRRTNKEPIAKPVCFEEMKRIAATLSQGMSHVRIDLYQVGEQIYFSEYTFYDWAGLTPFEDRAWDLKLGSYIKLPKSK